MTQVISFFISDSLLHTHCKIVVINKYDILLDRLHEFFIDYRFQQDAQVSFVVKAVSALTAAFRLVQLDHCSQSVLASCLRQVHSDLHEDILTNLRKLSFTSMGTSPTEVKGTQHHFTRNGRLVANKQLVFQINQAVGMESVSIIAVWIFFSFVHSVQFRQKFEKKSEKSTILWDLALFASKKNYTSRGEGEGF